MDNEGFENYCRFVWRILNMESFKLFSNFRKRWLQRDSGYVNYNGKMITNTSQVSSTEIKIKIHTFMTFFFFLKQKNLTV